MDNDVVISCGKVVFVDMTGEYLLCSQAEILAKLNAAVLEVAAEIPVIMGDSLKPSHATFVNGMLSQIGAKIASISKLSDDDVNTLKCMINKLAEKVNGTNMADSFQEYLGARIETITRITKYLIPRLDYRK